MQGSFFIKKGIEFRFKQCLNELDIKDKTLKRFQDAIFSEYPTAELCITEHPETSLSISVSVEVVCDDLIKMLLLHFPQEVFWRIPDDIIFCNSEIKGVAFLEGMSVTSFNVEIIGDSLLFSKMDHVEFWDTVQFLNNIGFSYNVESLKYDRYSLLVDLSQQL